MRVLIADKMEEQCQAKLREFPGIEVVVKNGLSPQALKKEIGDYEGLIVRSATKVTREIIEAGKSLKIIGRAGAGVDTIDVQAASERGIVVTNTPAGNSAAVAELVLGLMFALARSISQADASMKAGKWEKKNLMGSELARKTLGLVGIGSVGSRVARKARALEMKVLAYDPYVTPERVRELGAEPSRLEDLLRDSDYISIHVPKTKETAGLIDGQAFAKMKKGVYLVNCARGGIVVERDLLKALEEGKVAGAGLDVYDQEPPQDLSLCRHPRVVATPHIGASTQEAQAAVAEMIAYQMGRYLTRGEIINAVNG